MAASRHSVACSVVKLLAMPAPSRKAKKKVQLGRFAREDILGTGVGEREAERVKGRKARGLQMEEIGYKCQTFLSLLRGRRKQISNIFFLLYTNLKGGFS